MKNDLLLRTLRGEQTERTPVWMMRQAGRYLPEYMALREKYGFFEEFSLSPDRKSTYNFLGEHKKCFSTRFDKTDILS